MAVVVKHTKDTGISTENQKNAVPDHKINTKDVHVDGMCHFYIFLLVRIFL